MADHHHRLIIEAGHAADDRRIVGKRTVAVQFLKTAEQALNVIERVGALRVTRDLGDLPRRKFGVDILGQRLAFFLQPRDLFGNVKGRIVLHEAKFVDFRLKFGDRLFEFEKCRFHAGIAKRECQYDTAVRGWNLRRSSVKDARDFKTGVPPAAQKSRSRKTPRQQYQARSQPKSAMTCR